MHFKCENDITKEAIVLEWVISSILQNFELVKKRWDASVTVKCCFWWEICCYRFTQFL